MMYIVLTRKEIRLPIRMAEIFLDKSTGLAVISLLVKYYFWLMTSYALGATLTWFLKDRRH